MNIPLRLFGKRAGAAVLAATLTLALAQEAHAAPCASLPHPVYISGSSAVKNFVIALAAELAVATPPVTLIYAGPGSCFGVGYMTTNPPGKLTGGGTYWDTTLATPAFTGACTTDDANGGDVVTIGVSDVYAPSCGTTPLDASVKDFHGPIQTMTFVVPIATTGGSTAKTISAEAAYLVYGFGGKSTVSPWIGSVSPWNDVTFVEQRGPTSGTEQMIAAYINVPAAKFKGNLNAGSGNLMGALDMHLANGDAQKSIGILATDAADKNRTKYRELAYQHFGQSCTYLPDSSSTTFDKANVRDGHYPIWGPLHLITPVDNAGVPSNADAKKVIDYLTGATTPSSFDLIALEATGGVVPDCAMMVEHKTDVDGADIKAYTAAHTCMCKFEKEAAKLTTTPPGCTACTTADGTKDAVHCTNKNAPICNYHFCEAK